MILQINGVDVAKPSEFTVTTMDLDDGESTTRTADGTLNRDRIAVKRQIELGWPALSWDAMSSLLQAMDAPFFEVKYPDPMAGEYLTKMMYVGNRPAPMAIERNGVIYWGGLKVTLTER